MPENWAGRTLGRSVGGHDRWEDMRKYLQAVHQLGAAWVHGLALGWGGGQSGADSELFAVCMLTVPFRHSGLLRVSHAGQCSPEEVQRSHRPNCSFIPNFPIGKQRS